MKSSITFLLSLLTCGLAVGQGPENEQQLLNGPLIPELVAQYQDLNYDGLVAELAGAPAPRAAIDFDPTKARYFDVIRNGLELTEDEVEIYRNHGFVSIDNGRGYSFTTAYHDIYTSDLPVLITTDSILYALQKSHEAVLKELESTWFSVTLAEALGAAHEALGTMAKASQEGLHTANYRDVDLYLTIARHLLAGAGAPGKPLRVPNNPSAKKPKIESQLGQDDEVATLLGKIASLKLEVPGEDPPTRIYGGSRYLDYSQFKPRGHYADSVALRNYFRAMMWLSRADTGWNVLPVDPRAGLVSDDRRELRNAVLLLQTLRESGGLERLRAVNRVIAYLVGNSDSMNLFRLEQLMEKTQIQTVGNLIKAGQMANLQDAISKSEAARQFIRSQVLVSNPNDTHKVPPPATFQVFGQRFAIDSYVLSRVVYDSIIFEGLKQKRMMPTALDVMAAIGSNAAVPLLEDELRKWNYSANLLAGLVFVDQQNDEFWEKNLYSLWLDSLRKLDENLAGEPHAPQVMQTEVWQRKQLQTQLASWSQLRHNNVLYAKQSATGVPGCEYLSGYVEPYPAFYAKIKAFAERAHKLIEGAPYSSNDERESLSLRKIRERQLRFFSNMATRLGQLQNLARKELAAEPFTAEEREFLARTISKFGSAPLGSGRSMAYHGWYTELFYADQPKRGAFGGDYDGLSKFGSDDAGPVRFGRADMSFAPTIADVHTDPESRQVLQVGIGAVNLCVIAIDNEDDRMAFVGPVFSYYEFHQPAGNRLTDKQWTEMLDAASQPSRPSWVDSFVAPPNPRPKHGTFMSVQRKAADLQLKVSTHSKDVATKPVLHQLKVTDEGLAEIDQFPTLRSLDLSDSPITDQGLEPLAALKELCNLSLSSTPIDGSGLASLKQARWLRRLLLADTRVSDDAMPHLVALPRLEILDLSGTMVTSGSIEHLKQMTYLRELQLANTAIDEAGIELLQRALPKCRIQR